VAARGSIPKNLKKPVSPRPASSRDHCGDGYRFAKRHGKLNSANPAVIQQNKRFCFFRGCAARIRSDSIHREA
jgi:hypothetical protein